MALDYSDLDAVMELWASFESVSRYYKIGSNEEQVTELMEITKGTLGEKPFYRPYLVAAIFLEIQIDVNQITKADGVEFTNLRQPADTYRGLQRQIDGAYEDLGLVLPDAFDIPLCDPCGGDGGAVRPRGYVLLTGTRSINKSK